MSSGHLQGRQPRPYPHNPAFTRGVEDRGHWANMTRLNRVPERDLSAPPFRRNTAAAIVREGKAAARGRLFLVSGLPNAAAERGTQI